MQRRASIQPLRNRPATQRRRCVAVGSEDLASTLDQVAGCLAAGWAGDYEPVRWLDALRARLREQRLHLAVLGQFKRGKSTLINALPGAPVLPSAAVPVTAVPTFIAWAPEPYLRVVYQNDRTADVFATTAVEVLRERFRQFVTEQGNPENRRGTARVELYYPADILREGVVLIDTPGIGSTLQHNTDAALEALPECDGGCSWSRPIRRLPRRSFSTWRVPAAMSCVCSSCSTRSITCPRVNGERYKRLCKTRCKQPG